MGTPLVVFGDTHVGSAFALCPPDLDEPHIAGYRHRRWTWDCWEHAWACVDHWCQGRKPIIVHTADVIEGNHHDGEGVMPGMESEVNQTLTAIDVLRPVRERASVMYIGEGTFCHTKTHEQSIAAKLDCALANDGRRVFNRLALDYAGKRHVFTHHAPTSGRQWTKVGGLWSVAVNERLESMQAGERPTDVLWTAHAHISRQAGDSTLKAYSTLSWQASETRYGGRVVPHARTCIGMYYVEPDDEGGWPHVRELVYRPDPLPDIKHD